MQNNSIKAYVEPEIFTKLDYEKIKLELIYSFEPYKEIRSGKIAFEVEGDFEKLQEFNKVWADIEKKENARPSQIEYSFWDKVIMKIGNRLNFAFLPIAKITNKGRTEIYTLYKNGFVKIRSVSSKVSDMVMINMCSEESIKEFKFAVDKIAKQTH